jgi:hypothetical protein
MKLKSIRKVSLLVFSGIYLMLIVTCKKLESTGDKSISSIKYFQGGPSDKVNFIAKTNDGGFIYCGYTGVDSGKVDAFLMKVSADGKQEWYRTYGGSHYDDFRHVLPLADGGYLAVGQTNSIGKGSTDGTYKICDYAVKVNASGDEVWSKSYSLFPAVLISSYETADHLLLITGSNTITDINIILLKLDASGNFIYGKSYQTLNALPPFHISNNYNEYGRFVSLDEKGAVLIGGAMSKSGFATEVATLVPFILKANYTTGGATYLMPYYNYVSGPSYQALYPTPKGRRPWVKTLTLSDGYLLGSYIELSGPIIKMQLIKTDFNCNELWEKEYSGLGNAILYGLDANPDGTFMIYGESAKEPLNTSATEGFFGLQTAIINVDKNGNELWSSFTGSQINASALKSLRLQADGSMLGAGYSTSNETGYDKMFFLSLDSKGNLK